MLGGGGFHGNFPGRKPEGVKSRLGVVKSKAKSTASFTAKKPQKPVQRAVPKKRSSTVGVQKKKSTSSRPPAPAPGYASRRCSVSIVGKFGTWPWGQHPDEAYLADAIEAQGVSVHRVDQDDPSHEIPNSEWIICTGQEASCGRVNRYREYRKVAVWTLDWLPDYAERSHIISAGKKADLFITSDEYDWEKNYGIKHHVYLPAACETPYPPLQPTQKKRTCAFMGTLYNDRRKAIAELVKKHGGEVLGEPGKWVYGKALSRYVQETKVIIGDNSTNEVKSYWSSRNYIIPGAGGFLLTAKVPGLDDQFIPNKHIVTYANLKDLDELLRMYILADEARESVRRAGFHHVRSNHNWAVRAKSLLTRLFVTFAGQRNLVEKAP